jgi:hypothetical protein
MKLKLGSRKYPNLECLIDDEDYSLISNYKLSPYRSGEKFRVTAYDPQTQIKYLLHRVIMSPPASMVVDHINGDPLDNRRCNLRVCTQQQNSQNSAKPTSNTSGVKGVCFDKGSGLWLVRVGEKTIGRYRSLTEATLAYNNSAQEIFGEFAMPNQLPSEDKLLTPIYLPRVDNTSGYRGVASAKNGKFRAYFTHKGITTRLGTYYSKDDAAKAYNNKALEVLGINANLNIISPGRLIDNDSEP